MNQPTTPRFNRQKILIVEDDEFNRLYMLELLKRQNLEIDTATNRQETLEKVSQNDYDLILMDIKLPKSNGYDVTRELLRKNPNLKIIAQTAYAMEADRTKAMEAGCVDYISKPFLQNDLLHIISKHLS